LTTGAEKGDILQLHISLLLDDILSCWWYRWYIPSILFHRIPCYSILPFNSSATVWLKSRRWDGHQDGCFSHLISIEFWLSLNDMQWASLIFNDLNNS
jgi:hypothetical protein